MYRLLRKLSYRLESSIHYQNSKSFFHKLLNDRTYLYKRYFDSFMIALIVLSIVILVMDTSGSIPAWLVQFDLYFITAVFALEYLLRLWVSHDIHKAIIEAEESGKPYSLFGMIVPKLRYMFSLPALIDFIAIFPKFRIIRLLKLYHYMHGASSLLNALLKKRFEFRFLGYMLIGVSFTLGSIFYFLEFGKNGAVSSYLDAIYWALVTISTVGYGDISPVTDIGKMVAMVGIIFGIAMISFVTSVMVSAFSERFDELRNQDAIRYASKRKNVVIINGYGYLGRTVVKKLASHHRYEAVIVEGNATKANQASEDGYNVIYADGSSAKLIEQLYQTKNIAAMLTLTSSDIDNIYFILNAKSVKPSAKVYSRMNQKALQVQYQATNVDGMVEPYAVVDQKAFTYLKKYGMDRGILFLGYTYKSRHICKMLQASGIEVSIYDVKEQRLNHAKEDGFVSTHKIEGHSVTLEDIDTYLVVCAMDDEALNVYYSITLRANGYEEKIVALSDTKEDNRKLYLAGVSKIFDMYEESAAQFVEMIERGRHQ